MFDGRIFDGLYRAILWAVVSAFVLGCALTAAAVAAWPHLPSIRVVWP